MNFYKNLSEHDKRTLKIGGVTVALILFIFLVILPLKDKGAYYGRKIAVKEKSAREIAAMSKRYEKLKRRFDELRSAAKSEKGDFTLFSFLDRAASDADLKGHIKAMKPSTQSREEYTESTVMVELEDVALRSLVKYIHTIETSGHNIRIKKADIKPRYSDPEKINVTLLISSVELI